MTKIRKVLVCTSLILAMVMVGATGCGKRDAGADNSANNPSGDNGANVNVANDDNGDSEEMLEFADFLYTQFEFSSGAGAWSTDFFIYPDGSFYGQYNDSDMGDIGEGYEECGTRYVAVFSGHFTDLVKVGENAYEFSIKDITYRNEPGEERIAGGCRYIYSEAYGLCDTDKLKLYTKDTKLDDLSEETVSWIRMAIPEENPTVTGMYVIENVDQEEGITSFEYDPKEYAVMEASYDHNIMHSYEEMISSEDMTQLEYNMAARQCFDDMDYSLNLLWNTVKYTKSEDEFKKILETQRSFIADKEAKAKEAAGQYEGGSIYDMIYYESLAKSTLDRIDELVDML